MMLTIAFGLDRKDQNKSEGPTQVSRMDKQLIRTESILSILDVWEGQIDIWWNHMVVNIETESHHC